MTPEYERAMPPAYEGRNARDATEVIQRMLQEAGLNEYIPIIEGKPKRYNTVRYGEIESWDYLPIYIIDKNTREKIYARVYTERINGEDVSFGGAHDAYGTMIWHLEIGNKRVEAEVRMDAWDYHYTYQFRKILKIKNRKPYTIWE